MRRSGPRGLAEDFTSHYFSLKFKVFRLSGFLLLLSLLLSYDIDDIDDDEQDLTFPISHTDAVLEQWLFICNFA